MVTKKKTKKSSSRNIHKLLKYTRSSSSSRKKTKSSNISTKAKVLGTLGTAGALGSLLYLYNKKPKKVASEVATSPIHFEDSDIAKLKELLSLCDRENKILKENFLKAENSRKEWEAAHNYYKDEHGKCFDAYKKLKSEFDKVVALLSANKN